MLADRGRRRALILAGGVAFVATTALLGVVAGFVAFLAVEMAAAPASGAFVGLAQAALVDVAPARRQRSLAEWTLVGSLAVGLAPLLVVGTVRLGGSWRDLFLALAGLGAIVLLLARRIPPSAGRPEERLVETVRATLALLRSRDVVRWLVVLQAADLLLDVLHGFLALYLVDVTQVSPSRAALGVAVWTGAGLVGDAALLGVLRRVSGLRYLRWSALGVAVAYPAFMLSPALPAKLVALAALGLLNAGWYALPKAQLYAAAGDRSGAVLTLGTIGGLVGTAVPLAIGLVASLAGLGVALWGPLLAPLVVLILVPRGDG